MLTVKKYPNRRLYDTRAKRYITLQELEQVIRGGEDVAVHDVSDLKDLTQETLTQIIFERNNGRILPTSLLVRLIRLDDSSLGEFLTRYVAWALEVYVGAKQRAKSLLPINPLATAPFAATDALARLMLGAAQWGKGQSDANRVPSPAVAPEDPPFRPPPEPYTDEENARAGDMSDFPDLPPKSVADPKVAEQIELLRAELNLLRNSVRATGGRATKPPKKKPKKRSKTSKS